MINKGDLFFCSGDISLWLQFNHSWTQPGHFQLYENLTTVTSLPFHLRGDFLCTFCRSLNSPELEYCEDSRKITGEQSLSPEDQRVSIATARSTAFSWWERDSWFSLLLSLQRCERLLLNIFCHELSVGFRKPVPSSVSSSTCHTQTHTDLSFPLPDGPRHVSSVLSFPSISCGDKYNFSSCFFQSTFTLVFVAVLKQRCLKYTWFPQINTRLLNYGISCTLDRIPNAFSLLHTRII